jgi:hypothetical protein
MMLSQTIRVEVRRPFTAAAVLRSMSKAYTFDQKGNAAKGFRLWAAGPILSV